MGLEKGKDGQALRQIGFHPLAELGTGSGIALDGARELRLGLRRRFSIKNRANSVKLSIAGA
jgi:hypothetical protein